MRTLQVLLAKAFGVSKVNSAKPAYIKQEDRLDRNALAKAKRLAAKHGVRVERDRDGYWVFSDLYIEVDPLEGNHFCVGGREVLVAVETLINFKVQS